MNRGILSIRRGVCVVECIVGVAVVHVVVVVIVIVAAAAPRISPAEHKSRLSLLRSQNCREATQSLTHTEVEYKGGQGGEKSGKHGVLRRTDRFLIEKKEKEKEEGTF